MIRVQITVGGIERGELPDILDVLACAEEVHARSVQEGRYVVTVGWGDLLAAENQTRELRRRLAQTEEQNRQ